MKPDLSEIVGEKLYTLEEALDILGWSYTRSDDEETLVYDIKCCGELVTIVGIAGVDYAFCRLCEKGLCDMTGIVPLKPHLRGMIELRIMTVVILWLVTGFTDYQCIRVIKR